VPRDSEPGFLTATQSDREQGLMFLSGKCNKALLIQSD
jgi:hypothetical protein